MPIIQDTVEQIAEITQASSHIKPLIRKLVVRLTREIITKVINRHVIGNHQIADPTLCPRDEARVLNQTKQIIKRLISGPQTNYELMGITARYGARIRDARQKLRSTKWTIKSERLNGGTWVYSLIKR